MLKRLAILIGISAALTTGLAVPAAHADPIITPLVLGFLATVGIPATTTAVAVTTFALGLAISVGASFLSTLFQPKQDVGGLRTKETAGGKEPRQAPLGKVIMKGQRLYSHSYGPSRKFLQRVILLSDWEIESLDAVWIDGKRKTITSQTIPPGNNEFARYHVDGFGSLIVIRFFKGAAGQLADTELVANAPSADRWAATDIAEGQAYVSITFTYDKKDLNQFPDLAFEIKGAKLYDWRLDDTAGGVGPQRWATPSTWAYSHNPAVAAYNVLRGFWRGGEVLMGAGVSSAVIIQDMFTASANLCDEDVVEGSETVDRYRLGYLYSDGDSYRDSIEAILAAMGGSLVERTGLFGTLGGGSQSTVADLVEADLVTGAPYLVSAFQPNDAVANYITGNFSNFAKGGELAGYKEVMNAAWETTDGQRLARTLDLPMVFSGFQAHRLATIKAKESRLQSSVSIVVGQRWLGKEVGDWITFTSTQLGLRTYRIANRRLEEGALISFELKEIAASAYGDAGNYTPPARDDSTDPVPITTVAGFAVTPTFVGSAANKRPAINATWTPPDDLDIRSVRLRYRITGETRWQYQNEDDVEGGAAQLAKGVLASTGYDVQASITTKSERDATWTATATVTTNADWTGVGDTTAPGLASALTTAGRVGSIYLSWTNPTDLDFAHQQVWAASVNNFASAAKVAEVDASAWTHNNLGNAITRYYWLKSVDVSGNVSGTFPTGATSGVAGTTIRIDSDMIGDNEVIRQKLIDGLINFSKMAGQNPDNLALNGNFERGTLDPHVASNAQGTWSVDASLPYSGAYSCKFDPAGMTAVAALDINGAKTNLVDHLPCGEGDEFYFEFRGRATSAGAANDIQANIIFYDGASAIISNLFGTQVTPTTTYQKAFHSAAAPAGTAYMVCRLYVQNDGFNTNVLRFDQVYIRRKLSSETILNFAIINGLLAADAVTADKIAALQIFAKHMVLTDPWNMFADPSLVDGTSFIRTSGTGTLTHLPAGFAGSKYSKGAYTLSAVAGNTITAGRTWQPVTDGADEWGSAQTELWVNAAMRCTDSTMEIAAEFADDDIGTNPVAVIVGTAVNRVNFFRVNGAVAVTAGKKFWRPRIKRTGGGADPGDFVDILVTMRNQGELIVDGAIIANHVQASTMGADKWTTTVQSDNYTEDGAGIPLTGWKLDRVAGAVKAVQGVFAGGTSARGIWTFGNRSYRNGVMEGGEEFSLPYGKTIVKTANTDYIDVLKIRRYPDYCHVEISGELDNVVVGFRGTVPIYDGKVWPTAISVFEAASNKSWEIDSSGYIWWRNRTALGVVVTETKLARLMWPLEMDPLNTAGAAAVYCSQEMAARPIVIQVPAGKNFLTAKLWGAGGGGGNDAAVCAGPGGYATAKIPVTPLEMLILVIGEVGGKTNIRLNQKTVGFGGGALGDYARGGGLTGIFRGSIGLSTALLIAGGGGAAGDDLASTCGGSSGGHTTWAGSNGHSGVDTWIMSGVDALEAGARRCGGGGGKIGGGNLVTAVNLDRGGRGGTNYSDAANTAVTLSANTNVDANGYMLNAEFAPPNTADANYTNAEMALFLGGVTSKIGQSGGTNAGPGGAHLSWSAT